MAHEQFDARATCGQPPIQGAQRFPPTLSNKNVSIPWTLVRIEVLRYPGACIEKEDIDQPVPKALDVVGFRKVPPGIASSQTLAQLMVRTPIAFYLIVVAQLS